MPFLLKVDGYYFESILNKKMGVDERFYKLPEQALYTTDEESKATIFHDSNLLKEQIKLIQEYNSNLKIEVVFI